MFEPRNLYPTNHKKQNQNKYLRDNYRIELYAASEKNNKERAIQNAEKYGNSKCTNEGMMARIFGEYLLDISLDKLSKKGLQSFLYGYREAANRQISIMCKDNKISEFILTAARETTKITEEDIEKLSIEKILFNIGYRDAKDKYIDTKDLNENIKNNVYYSEGYLTAIQETKQNGRGR